jgi:DNA segregation ATPase FtsK/SpoIIIE, S-DNA-T family
MARPKPTEPKRTRRSSKKELPEVEDLTPHLPSISERTMRAVWGFLMLALAVFCALAGFNASGTAGTLVSKYLGMFLGAGYILLPLSLFISSVVLFKSFDRAHVGTIRMVSIIFFFIASLCLLEIGIPGSGGMLGSYISLPLSAYVGSIPAIGFLLATVCGSLLISLDTHPADIFERFMASIPRRSTQESETDELPEYDDTEPDFEDDSSETEEHAETNDTTPVGDTPVRTAIAPEDYAPRLVGDDDVMLERTPHIHAPFDATASAAVATAPMPASSSNPLQTYDPALARYAPPPTELLGKNKGKPGVGDVKANTNVIKRTLANFGIQVEMDEVSIGPTVTRYSMKPAEGVRLNKIVTLQSNLELALAASPIRIEAPIPGKSLVGIEVPNTSRTTLGLSPMLADPAFGESDKPLLMALGRDISGTAVYANLAKAPHLLVAGTTGSGKSVTIHNLILSLLYRLGPQQLRFVFVDPKRVELTLYKQIPHLLTPVITDAKKAVGALKWLTKEMERRYDVLQEVGVRDIQSYHETIVKPATDRYNPKGNDAPPKLPEPMPYIVVVIDELADLMQQFPREIEAGIVRLAQMSRAVGIHLILATQRPSVKVITGLIKANVPTRLALQVVSQIDSRVILDGNGAETLLGAGDMLYLSGELSKPRRVQSAYVTEGEVKKVAEHIFREYGDILPQTMDLGGIASESSGGFPMQLDDAPSDVDDDLFMEAKAAVQEAGKASTSYLQRKLRIGYSRAARLMDLLEEHGIIGASDGAKPREILGAASVGAGSKNSEDDF